MAYVYSGDTPGAGIYVCTECGASIRLATDTTEMPECPRCGNDEFLVTK
ncbi:MAG: hypothetical protein IKD59_01430 [Lachnospiraceae bacterium]|nr:hypothetical protein [Lachnospiraceae bacterium]